jgi:hypothetical protein
MLRVVDLNKRRDPDMMSIGDMNVAVELYQFV